MPTPEQLEVVEDLREDGKRVTLVPPRAPVSFVSGGAGAPAGSGTINTWMIATEYQAGRLDGKTITTRDSRMMLAAGAFPDDTVPGTGWTALVAVLPRSTFPVAGEPGVRIFEIVRLDEVVWEGEVPIVYFLQVRT